MRTVLAMLLGVALVSGRAEALDRWTWQDTAWEVTFTALVAADVAQTKWALRHGEDEMNPLLGKHPTDLRLDAVAIGIPAAHAAIAYALPAGAWRRGWQMLWVGVEGHTVFRSYQAGVRFSF